MHHILLTTDENYAQHCSVCIVSLLLNNPGSSFSFVVAGIDLDQKTKMNLLKTVEPFSNATLKVVDFSVEKLNDFPQIGFYQKNIYLRLWVDEFFDQDVEKVLYLDVDTIVVDSIEELFDIDDENFVIAAVDIPFSDSHKRCHLPLDYNYFNSGVIVFNVKRWREDNCRKQILDFLLENKDIALNPDQDALNGVFYKRRLTLDYTYNVISPFFRKKAYEKLGDAEISRVRENAKIIHFNGRARPWFYTCNHPYQKKYFRYLNQTPWKSFKPEDKTVINYLKKKIRLISGMETFVNISNTKGV